MPTLHLTAGGETMQLTDRQLNNAWAKVDVHLEDECWWWTGSRTRGGYGQFMVGQAPRRAHRVMYQIMIGDIPDGMLLDHSCRNPLCVNPKHMRVCNKRENAGNSKVRVDSGTGIKGVSFIPKSGRWRASIGVCGKYIHLGCFATPQEASTAYSSAAHLYFKEFANPVHSAEPHKEEDIEDY